MFESGVADVDEKCRLSKSRRVSTAVEAMEVEEESRAALVGVPLIANRFAAVEIDFLPITWNAIEGDDTGRRSRFLKA